MFYVFILIINICVFEPKLMCSFETGEQRREGPNILKSLLQPIDLELFFDANIQDPELEYLPLLKKFVQYRIFYFNGKLFKVHKSSPGNSKASGEVSLLEQQLKLRNSDIEGYKIKKSKLRETIQRLKKRSAEIYSKGLLIRGNINQLLTVMCKEDKDLIMREMAVITKHMEDDSSVVAVLKHQNTNLTVTKVAEGLAKNIYDGICSLRPLVVCLAQEAGGVAVLRGSDSLVLQVRSLSITSLNSLDLALLLFNKMLEVSDLLTLKMLERDIKHHMTLLSALQQRLYRSIHDSMSFIEQLKNPLDSIEITGTGCCGCG